MGMDFLFKLEYLLAYLLSKKNMKRILVTGGAGFIGSNYINSVLSSSEDLIEYVKDRFGHDRRSAIDSSKIQNELGWSPQFDFANAIENTIDWYLNNKNWWESIISGDYRNYYKKQYGHR
jgi:dTDP-D-glucose 4,6-dehydratase